MAFRRRFRKFNGIWAPCVQQVELQRIAFPIGSTGGIAIQDASQILSGDEPIDDSTAPTLFGGASGGLALATRQSFTIQRIVGKVHVAAEFPGDTANWAAFAVKCGIFVDRVDNTGVLQNLAAWDQFGESSKQKRFLWQRSWMLQNNFPLAVVSTQYPVNNASYGSLQDGPNVDIKVKARISYEERLFFLISVEMAQLGTSPTATEFAITLWKDFRALLKPTSRNNR